MLTEYFEHQNDWPTCSSEPKIVELTQAPKFCNMKNDTTSMVMDATFSAVLNNVLMLRRHDNRLLWLPNLNNKYSPNTIVFNKNVTFLQAYQPARVTYLADKL